jgi:hypothetical protein
MSIAAAVCKGIATSVMNTLWEVLISEVQGALYLAFSVAIWDFSI